MLHRNPCRRHLLGTLAALPALGLLPAMATRAQAPAAPREGTDYIALSTPQPTESPGKIEVEDFFWYGCSHCYQFLPHLEAWKKRLPADVAVRRVPVNFQDITLPHTQIYYALLALGKAEDMHVKVFAAIHVQHKRLLEAAEIREFMVANGIDGKAWDATYNAFSVGMQARRASGIWRSYAIDGTPTLACDGRFLTSPSIVPSHDPDAALSVMNYLIERVRRERGHRAG
jgi:thiol:disulfide interchange protein DsbA